MVSRLVQGHFTRLLLFGNKPNRETVGQPIIPYLFLALGSNSSLVDLQQLHFPSPQALCLSYQMLGRLMAPRVYHRDFHNPN